MTTVREAKGDMPELVRIAEISMDELYKPSGMPDPKTGEPLTKLDAFRHTEELLHGGDIILSANGLMSDEGKSHNSRVTRTGEGVLKAALIARRPAPWHKKYGE